VFDQNASAFARVMGHMKLTDAPPSTQSISTSQSPSISRSPSAGRQRTRIPGSRVNSLYKSRKRSPGGSLLRAQIVVLVVVRVRRPLVRGQRVLFQLLHDDLDPLFELRIATRPERLRLEVHVDVRRHAAVLHFPVAA